MDGQSLASLFGKKNGNQTSYNNTTQTVVQKCENIPRPPYCRLPHNLCGIQNQGATCYLNSLLQTLLFTPEFRESLLHLPPAELGDLECPENFSKVRIIPIQLQRLFARMLLCDRNVVPTTELTDSFGWTNNEGLEHQDVQELNRILFSAIENSLVGTSGKDIISQLYHGSVVNQITCVRCGNVSEREECFQDLTVAVKDLNSLEESLHASYIQTETMDGNNKYFCEICAELVDATKGAKLRCLPPILTISLMRFSYNLTILERYKETSRFTFSQDLDMSPFYDGIDVAEDDLMYELFSVIIHQGNPERGHYHAYIKDIEGLGSWTLPTPGPFYIPVEWEGREEILECETPLQILTAILAQQSEQTLPMDHLCKNLCRYTGSPWNRCYRKQCGSITRFVESQPDHFYFCQENHTVTLSDIAYEELKQNIIEKVAREATINSIEDSPTIIKHIQLNGEIEINSNGIVPKQNGMDHDSPNNVTPHWFDFNDDEIQCIVPDEITRQFAGKESAYMLFYRKRSLSKYCRVKHKTESLVPQHLIHMVQEENILLRSQREEYELYLNHICLNLLHCTNCCLINGAVRPTVDGQMKTLRIDRGSTVAQLKENVKALFVTERIPSPFYLHVCVETSCGLHASNCLSDDSETLKHAGLTHENTLLVWDGKEIRGKPYLYGAFHQPILLNVSLRDGSVVTSEIDKGFPVSMTLGLLRQEMAAWTRCTSVDDIILSYSGPNSKKITTMKIMQDHRTLEDLGFKDKGHLRIERNNRGSPESMSPTPSLHAYTVESMLHMNGHVKTENNSPCVTIQMQEDATVFDLKKKVLCTLGLSDEFLCRLRVENEDGLMQPPPTEETKLQDTGCTTNSRILLQEGAPITNAQFFISFSFPFNQTSCHFELILEKSMSVISCIRFVLDHIARKDENENMWQLHRTSWSGDPTVPITPSWISLEAAGVHQGEHIWMKAAPPPALLPTPSISDCYWKVTLWLIPSCVPELDWEGSEEIFTVLTDTWHGLQQVDMTCINACPYMFGELDISDSTNLSCIRSAALDQLNEFQVLDPLQLRIWQCVDHDKSSAMEVEEDPSTYPTNKSPTSPVTNNSLLPLTNNSMSPSTTTIDQKNLELFPFRVLRGNHNTVKALGLSGKGVIGIQILPYKETLGPNDLVLFVLELSPPPTYPPDFRWKELTWKANSPYVTCLSKGLSTLTGIPENNLLAAKFFPGKNQWTIICDGDGNISDLLNIPKMKRRTSLKAAPYYINDGDVIAVKDLRLEWETPEDFTACGYLIEMKMRGKREEDNENRKRRHENLDPEEGIRKQRAEEGIHIHVGDFS